MSERKRALITENADMKTSGQDKLSELPVEIQQKIIRFLPIDDIIAVADTNSILRYAVQDDLTRITSRQDPNKLLEELKSTIQTNKVDAVNKIISMFFRTYDLNQNDGWEILRFAVERGDIDIVRALVNAGMDVIKAEENDIGLVYTAAKYGHLNIVKYLVEEKHVDPNKENKDGYTPRLAAREAGHKNIAKYIDNYNFNRDTREIFKELQKTSTTENGAMSAKMSQKRRDDHQNKPSSKRTRGGSEMGAMRALESDESN